jgi:hypothetical protein
MMAFWPNRGGMMRIQAGWNFSERTAGHLPGYPSLSRHAESFCSLGSFFELDLLKKEIGHQSPQS